MNPCAHCRLPVPPSRRDGFCCFGCRVAHEVARPAAAGGEAPALPSLRTRLAFGGFVAMNVMALNFSFYAPDVFGAGAEAGGAWGELSSLFGYLMLFLSSLVVALLGLPLFADALQFEAGRRLPRFGAQLLIVSGVFAAYVLSAIYTVTGVGRPYYDTATLVLVVVTLGHYVEARAKRRAAERLVSALDALPARVVVRRGADEAGLEIDAAEVRVGDLVRVRPGEAAVVDGVARSGAGHVDTRRLTGESRPRAVAPGDEVLAGSISLDGDLWIEAVRVSEDRTLARIEELLEQARTERPAAQRLADRIAAVFTPVVVALALATFGVLAATGNAAEGLLRGLAVVLIACPCALAIAPSLTVVSAMRRAAERGILFASGAVVERTAALRFAFFDKTGTLTESATEVLSVKPTAGVAREHVLEVLAAVESGSTHPIARGLRDYAEMYDVPRRRPESCRVLPGLGLEARLDGRTYRVGGPRLLVEAGFRVPGADDEEAIYLLEGDRLLARVRTHDRMRSEAAAAVATLRELGIDVAGLSGDRPAPAARLAEQLGLPIEAGLMPDDKLNRMRRVREGLGGGGMGMVGDGINDAPALAAADVGFALAGGTDLSRQSGHVLLVGDRLDGVPAAVRTARDARRRLRWTLAWTFAYNGIGLGLAVAGWLHPAFAATAMVFSSLLVIGYARGAGRFGDGGASPVTGENVGPAALARGAAT